MTPRERVLAALSHKEPDRVPIDVGGTESSSISGVAYANLCDYLGLKETPRIYDVAQQVSYTSETLRQRFHIDTMALAYEPAFWRTGTLTDGRGALLPALWQPERLADGSQVVRNASGEIAAVMPPGGYYFDSGPAPMRAVTNAAELSRYSAAFDNYDKPPFLDEGWDDMAERARKLHTETDYCIAANLMLHVLAAGQGHRGFEAFMMDLIADESLACAVMERQLESYFPRIDTYAGKMAQWVDVVLLCDDLGAQGGPLLSPETYRKTVKKYHAQLFAHIKKRFGKPLLLHSCGSVYKLIPDLIEIGVDALNPVQVSAADMDSARLKKEFGKDIVFWGGGCDTQAVLGKGSPEDVRREVKRRIEDFAPGGGYVFTQVHNIQPNVPPQNIVAMLEAAMEYGRY